MDNIRTVLVCDEDYERHEELLAVCQDRCSLPLDHDGECDDRYRPGMQVTCDDCGKEDRLTRVGERR